MPLINFKFSIVTVRETVKCVDISTEQIWLMMLNINTICYRLESLFQFFFSPPLFCSSDIRTYFISHFFLMWFEIMDLVILRFQYSCVFFYLSSSQIAKNMEKKSEAKKKILICNEKKEVILFFHCFVVRIVVCFDLFFFIEFFSLQFFLRYVNVRFSWWVISSFCYQQNADNSLVTF